MRFSLKVSRLAILHCGVCYAAALAACLYLDLGLALQAMLATSLLLAGLHCMLRLLRVSPGSPATLEVRHERLFLLDSGGAELGVLERVVCQGWLLTVLDFQRVPGSSTWPGWLPSCRWPSLQLVCFVDALDRRQRKALHRYLNYGVRSRS